MDGAGVKWSLEKSSQRPPVPRTNYHYKLYVRPYGFMGAGAGSKNLHWCCCWAHSVAQVGRCEAKRPICDEILSRMPSPLFAASVRPPVAP